MFSDLFHSLSSLFVLVVVLFCCSFARSFFLFFLFFCPGGLPGSSDGRRRSSSLTEEEVADLKLKFEQEKTIEMNSLREQMMENERLMQEQTKTWEERLKETKLAAEEQVKQLSRAGISVGAGDNSGKNFEMLQGKGADVRLFRQKNSRYFGSSNASQLMHVHCFFPPALFYLFSCAVYFYKKKKEQCRICSI